MEEIIYKILSKDAKFIDIRFQESNIETIILKDGKVEDIKFDKVLGGSVRIVDKKISFASVNDIKKLPDIFDRIYKTSRQGEESIEINIEEVYEDNKSVEEKIKLEDVDIEERVNYLKELYNKTKKYPEIISSTLILSFATVRKHYYNSEGSKIFQELKYVSLYASCFSKKNDKLQVAFERKGGIGGFELVKHFDIDLVCERAIRLLDAKKPKAGKYKVILDPKLAGVFIHEALGHAVEADHVLRGESILKDKLGLKIGSELLNVYDDATLRNAYGFYFYDDEGVKAKRKILVKNGILKSFLTSRETSKRLNLNLTGNARAQNFSYLPIVRMSNTFIERGDHSFEEMLEDIDFGYYLIGSKGGEVDTTRGVFQFSAEEGYVIERGEIKYPIRDISMSGEIVNVLKTIDAVGKDLDFHIGHCGKESQLVPVSDGSPHIRCIVTVGGI